MGEHLVEVDGEVTFQSDKFTWCKPGFVPLKLTDPMAQDLLAEYARRRRAVDAGFSDDVEHVLELRGYAGLGPRRIVLNGIPVMEPPDGPIRMDVGMRHADGSTEVREWTYTSWDSFVEELTQAFRNPATNALRDGLCVVRVWREASLVATLMPVHVTPDPMVDEPTTAVESPQAKRASSHPPERPICSHCGDPACWLGNECQGRVRSRYEFERAERAKRSAAPCPVCQGMTILPCFMDAPGGPRCACGRPSVRESGECLVEHGALPCPRCGTVRAAPLDAVCARCVGTKRVCECRVTGELLFGMHRAGCDTIPRTLCPICMAGQQDTLPLLGWNYVCDPCLGDESTKSIGVIAWPSHCQCCGSFELGPKTARPVSPEQLQRIRQRVLEAPRAGG